MPNVIKPYWGFCPQLPWQARWWVRELYCQTLYILDITKHSYVHHLMTEANPVFKLCSETEIFCSFTAFFQPWSRLSIDKALTNGQYWMRNERIKNTRWFTSNSLYTFMVWCLILYWDNFYNNTENCYIFGSLIKRKKECLMWRLCLVSASNCWTHFCKIQYCGRELSPEVDRQFWFSAIPIPSTAFTSECVRQREREGGGDFNVHQHQWLYTPWHTWR
jgi:hypothetical protein